MCKGWWSYLNAASNILLNIKENVHNKVKILRQKIHDLPLTPSLPWCHLKTTIKVRNLKALSLFVFFFTLACERIFIKTHSIENRSCRTVKYTVCRRIRASFSPVVLQARAVKGLKVNSTGKMQVARKGTQSMKIFIQKNYFSVCFQFQLLNMWACWFAIHQWKPQKGCLSVKVRVMT